jgi:DNA-directed RNA polymerase specialized sigma24 family protein
MPSYQYDPSGSFRGWLRRLCHCRAIDLYRERRDFAMHALRDQDLIDATRSGGDNNDAEWPDNRMACMRLLLLREAEAVQEEVRRQVKPIRWEIFWRVVIEGESMTETAAALGLKYATAYAAANHVAHLLRAAGQRRRARLGLGDAPRRAVG